MSDSISSTTSKGILGLGKGNSTNLNDELIVKLKSADTKAQVDPIKKNIDKTKERQEDLSALKILADKLNTSFGSLDNEALYEKREVISAGTSASVSATPGVSLQDLSIDVRQLAQRDSYQTNKFKTQFEQLGATDGSFKVHIRGVSYDINVKPSSSLQDIADQINERTGFDIQARIINTGGEKPYQMIIQSKGMGVDQQITFSNDTSGVLEKLGLDDTKNIPVLDDKGKPVLNDDGSPKNTSNFEKNRLTKAQDANFLYNGLEITRSTNTITDLRVGLTINLKEEGKSNFNVVQDTKDIVKNLEEMIKDYNILVKNLNISTSYDEETKQSGNFQGISEITTMRTNLNRIFTQPNENGKSISDFGLTFSKSGELSFGFIDKNGLSVEDNSKFLSALSQDANAIKEFFMGSTTTQSLTYTAQGSVKDGVISLKTGDLTINGRSILLEETKQGTTAKDNALAVLKAINDAGLDGVYASLNKDETGIIIKTLEGVELDIKANENATKNFGISSINMIPQTTTTEGIFTKLNKKLKEVTDENSGTLQLYGKRLKDESEKLTKEKEKIETSLNQKYDTMRERWVIYSRQISELESQFASLKSMIDFELNSKK